MGFKEYLKEGKATSFEPTKLKAISIKTILDILSSYDFRNKRLAYDKKRNEIGGTLKDTKELIKAIIKKDMDATKELGHKTSKEQLDDYKYLKSI